MTAIVIIIIVILVGYQALKWVMTKQPIEDKVEYLEKMRVGMINKLMNEISLIEKMSSNKGETELNLAIRKHIQDFRKNAKTNTHKMELIKATSIEVLQSVVDSACDYVDNIYIKDSVCHNQKDKTVTLSKEELYRIEEFERLVKSENVDIRESVARNPDCPVWLLEELSEDEFLFVRSMVGENPNCPLKLLGKLISNGDVEPLH